MNTYSAVSGFAPGSLRLAVLQQTVPNQNEVVTAALEREFNADTAVECVLPVNERAVDALPPRVGRELLLWGRRCEQARAVNQSMLYCALSAKPTLLLFCISEGALPAVG